MNWSEFKTGLSTKKEKEAFNIIIENAKFYTQYLSDANRPIPLEPILMGAVFHNYKKLLKLYNEEDNVIEESIERILANRKREKRLANALFDKTCEKWHGLLYSLHKEDREQLLRMLVDCCYGLDEGVAKMLADKDSESSISVHFFFRLVLQNQKLINRIKKFRDNCQ